jgi:hypothetical protein
MKASNLLPFKVKRLGWLILLPSLLLGVAVMYFEYEIGDFELVIPYTKDFLNSNPITNNLTDELASVLFMASLILIAFSEEKEEDEFVSMVRLESLQWSVYFNYGLLIVTILFVYDMAFFQVLIYNMYSILIFFILRFNYVLRVKFNPSKIEIHEK